MPETCSATLLHDRIRSHDTTLFPQLIVQVVNFDLCSKRIDCGMRRRQWSLLYFDDSYLDTVVWPAGKGSRSVRNSSRSFFRERYRNEYLSSRVFVPVPLPDIHPEWAGTGRDHRRPVSRH